MRRKRQAAIATRSSTTCRRSRPTSPFLPKPRSRRPHQSIDARCSAARRSRPIRDNETTKKPASPPASVDLNAKLESLGMRGFQRRLFLLGNRALDRRLHLLEGADLDLTHALAGDAEFGGEILQGHRLVRQAPRLEDAAFARVEHADRAGQ